MVSLAKKSECECAAFKLKVRLFVTSIVLLFALFINDAREVMADELERAFRAFNARDYVTAGILLRKLAREGEENAYSLLGQFYQLGTGRPMDLYEALYWTRKSPYTADARRIEQILGRGISLPESDREVAALYLQQAAKGDVGGLYRAALVRETGRGIEQDDAAAFEFYRKAARAGHAYAQYEVAVRYFEGHGVEKDRLAAAVWMERASEQGLTIAKHIYADFLVLGIGMTAASEAAFSLYKSAAEDGYARSQMIFGGLLLRQSETREQRVESLKWLILSLPLVDQREAKLVGQALNAAAKRVEDPTEFEEASSRAKAFVRRHQ